MFYSGSPLGETLVLCAEEGALMNNHPLPYSQLLPEHSLPITMTFTSLHFDISSRSRIAFLGAQHRDGFADSSNVLRFLYLSELSSVHVVRRRIFPGWWHGSDWS